LVVTTLTNHFMPLIGIVSAIWSANNPTARYIVHGRCMDSFRLPTESRVTPWQVDECFRDIEGIAHYQLVERTREKFLRFVADRTSPAPEIAELRARLLRLFKGEARDGGADGSVMPESSGKFRLLPGPAHGQAHRLKRERGKRDCLAALLVALAESSSTVAH
jgi:hypothetical protein